MGRGELVPCFALFVCMDFALPIKLFLSQLMSFLPLTLSILFPLGEVSEQLRGAEFLAGVK